MSIFYLSESTINDYIILQEKKTRDQYAREKFKKKYGFKPDKPGSNIGTISVDGKMYKVNMSKDKTFGTIKHPETGKEIPIPRRTSAHINDPEKRIELGSEFFKLKGSRHGERRDALLSHEIGHQELHGIRAAKQNKSSKLFKDINSRSVKDMYGVDMSNDRHVEILGQIGGYTEKDPHKLRKKIYDDAGAKIYYDDMPDKKTQKDREKTYSVASRYAKGTSHSHPMEYEADRYAANRTSDRALKKGVANIYKIMKKDKKPGDERKKFNAMASDDMKQRSKALKDKELRSSKHLK